MEVRWSDRAEAGLDAIVDYISTDNPRAALSIYEEIRRQVRRLGDFPQSGRPGRAANTRELVVAGTPYLVVYRVSSDAVFVLRVLHGAQRWPPR